MQRVQGSGGAEGAGYRGALLMSAGGTGLRGAEGELAGGSESAGGAGLRGATT